MTTKPKHARSAFKAHPLHRRKDPHAFHFLSQRVSFWVASFALLAFVTGNMVGQHGWRVFWKSVLGRMDDSLIVYTGTVTPIAAVPDYGKWVTYGGDPQAHTFRQVPQDALVALPGYRTERKSDDRSAIYSVEYLGSYTTGEEGSGSHPGVDIRVPIGTPVRAVAAGIVSEVKEGGGFGTTVVIRHPNIPDPSNPEKAAVLYSNYAHLSAAFVEEGDIVEKGQQVALSGMTGDASGPHLHFQIDRDTAPWHPYWPFSGTEAREAGLTTSRAVNTGFKKDRAQEFTVNPMLFVEANYAAPTLVAEAETPPPVDPKTRMKSLFEERKAQRMARIRLADLKVAPFVRQTTVVSTTEPTMPEVTAIEEQRSSASSVSSANTVVSSASSASSVAPIAPLSPAPAPFTEVTSVEIFHDGTYTERGWERVRITLLDKDGNVVRSPLLKTDLYLRTAFGSAEFRPSVLSTFDFDDGRAEVNMLPFGRRTVIIEVQPLKVMSEPMKYEGR